MAHLLKRQIDCSDCGISSIILTEPEDDNKPVCCPFCSSPDIEEDEYE